MFSQKCLMLCYYHEQHIALCFYIFMLLLALMLGFWFGFDFFFLVVWFLQINRRRIQVLDHKILYNCMKCSCKNMSSLLLYIFIAKQNIVRTPLVCYLESIIYSKLSFFAELYEKNDMPDIGFSHLGDLSNIL